MTKIVTVGREFGSGGREVGKRLADALGIAYYDKELITKIAQKSSFSEQFVESILENGAMQRNYLTFGHTFADYAGSSAGITEKILSAQREVIERLAESDCVIVGRCADLILAEKRPFRLFVYADEQSKLQRCRRQEQITLEEAAEHTSNSENVYVPAAERLSDRKLLKKIRAVDKGRKKLYGLFYCKEWGNRENYDLCVNTSHADIPSVVPCIAEYIKKWYESK